MAELTGEQSLWGGAAANSNLQIKPWGMNPEGSGERGALKPPIHHEGPRTRLRPAPAA